MWVPPRSTAARLDFCLGDAARLAPHRLPASTRPLSASFFLRLPVLYAAAASSLCLLSSCTPRRSSCYIAVAACSIAAAPTRLGQQASSPVLRRASFLSPSRVLVPLAASCVPFVPPPHPAPPPPLSPISPSAAPATSVSPLSDFSLRRRLRSSLSFSPRSTPLPSLHLRSSAWCRTFYLLLHDDEIQHAVVLRGVEQTIEIPLKTILVKVMKSLPAKEAPVFDCVRDGSSYQANVLLNVSGTRFTSEPVVSVAKVLGDVCSGEDEALLSAVENASEYLEKNHLIHIADWSSKVAENYEEKRVFSDLNECSYAIEKVIAEWSQVIDTVGNFQSELERKEMLETVHDMRSAVGKLYSEGNEFVGSVIKTFIEKHRAMYLEWRECESQRSMHLKVCNDKTTGNLMKGLSEVVYFNEKDVLDYVLEFIGLKKAEYSNEVLLKSGLFRGEVIIQLPEVEEARCGGRTKFHGIDLFTAAEAEEDAAGKALRYLETKLKLSIVDKNYADRVEAKNNHVFRTRLLENFLDVAEKIKEQWAHMNEYMNGAVHVFAGEGVLISADQVAARKIVFDGFVKVGDDCNSRYEAACSKINDMYKYYPKVSRLYN